ncbi:MAG: exopolyphosphatase [Bacteroidetes bacterium]|nr:exopolyphosphatase [Bacteroidota bacterium]
MLFSSIDIGSNAVRLFFANVFEVKGKSVLEKASLIRIPLRLGEDVFRTGSISETRIENLLKTMHAFKLLIDVYKPLDYVACATSAMREALNNKEIIKRIYSETGINVKIIDGEEEAQIVCAVDKIYTSKKYNITMYIDVGGGSTEMSVVRNHKLIDSKSFNIGTLRTLSEANINEWDKMNDWLRIFKNEFGKIYIVGSGGNINKLSKMYSTQTGNCMSYPNLKQGYKHLLGFTLQQRIEQLGLRPDRADVIIPAAEIFLNIMKITQSELIFVPRIGLSDGLIYTVY